MRRGKFCFTRNLHAGNCASAGRGLVAASPFCRKTFLRCFGFAQQSVLMRCGSWRSRHGSDSGPPDIATRRQLPQTLKKVMGVVLTIIVGNGGSDWRRDAPKCLIGTSIMLVENVKSVLFLFFCKYLTKIIRYIGI